MIPLAWQEYMGLSGQVLLRLFESLSHQIGTEARHLMGQIKQVMG